MIPFRPGEPAPRDHLGQEEVVGLLVAALADQVRRGDGLGRGVDALEPLAPRDHRVADPPEVVQGERAVLAPAVVVDPGARLGRVVAVADLAALAQREPHLLDGRSVLRRDLRPIPVVPLAAHEHPPVGELLHRADGQPAAPVEEPPLAVGQPRPVVLAVVQHAGVEHQVLGAGDQHERVELEVLHRAHRLRGPLEAAPAAARPQPLTAEHVATGGLVGDVDGAWAGASVTPASYGRSMPGGGRYAASW